MAPENNVVGEQYTSPDQLDLTIVKKLMTEGDFKVKDAAGNIMFTVERKAFSLHSHSVLLDASGSPILSFRKKVMSIRSNWKAYRGDGYKSEDLLFSVRRTSSLQINTNLDVFLASNTSKEDRDFEIKGSWHGKSCTINAETNSPDIAKMDAKSSFSTIVLGKDKFVVTVMPNVDYAFILALILIRREFEEITTKVTSVVTKGFKLGNAAGGGGN